MKEVSLVALERKRGLETRILMTQSRGFGKAMPFHFSLLSPSLFGFIKRMLFYLREQCMPFQHPYFIQAGMSIPMLQMRKVKPRDKVMRPRPLSSPVMVLRPGHYPPDIQPRPLFISHCFLSLGSEDSEL